MRKMLFVGGLPVLGTSVVMTHGNSGDTFSGTLSGIWEGTILIKEN